MKEEFRKIIKFILAGGSSTAIDFVIYIVLSKWLNVTLAKFISMCISCTYSYCINKVWTFRVAEKTNVKYIVKYALCQIINIMVNVGTNTYLYNLIDNKLISYVIATSLAMMCNYFLQRFLVFRKGDV